MSASLLQECWDRVDRADTHAKAFVKPLERFLNDKAYSVVAQLSGNGKGVLKVVPHVLLDTSILALELGEFFYQLRAALDSLMWKLYEIFGTSEATINESQLYFPIVTGKERTFNKATANKLRLPQELRDWIRLIQPCFADERSPDSEETTFSDALLVINECAITDRHRHLHVLAALVSASTATILVRPLPAAITYQQTTIADFFKDEFVIVEFGIIDADDRTEVAAEGQFKLHITVQEIPALKGDDLAKTLLHLADTVRSVIRTVEAYII